MRRERVVCAYPGTAKVGVSLWILEDSRIARVALGTAEATTVGPLFERFDPDLLIIEAGRDQGVKCAPFHARSRDLNIVHPGWRDAPLRKPQRGMSYLAHNAWRMGFHQLVRRGRYKIGILSPEPLTHEWLDRHSPSWSKREG